LPAHYGATFFPTCATTVDDMLRRAAVALRIADNNANRVQLDGAEAPEMPPAETLRQPEAEEIAAEPVSQPAPAAMPALRIVEPLATVHPEPDRVLTIVEPTAEEPEAPFAVPTPLIAAKEPEAPFAAPTPFHAVEPQPAAAAEPHGSAHPDATEMDETAPARLFPYRAPEPAVDVYNNSWRAEAPLSVIRRPQSTKKLVALNGGVSKSEPPADDVLSNALKQLDGTLELIRSIKQRSA
jgi:hypothetical protein